MTIVGIGEDGRAGLSPAAAAALDTASVVYGGRRHLALAAPLAAEIRCWPSPIHDAYPDILARRGRPTCLLHPEDGARLGIATGDAIEIGNVRGRVRLHARLAEGQQPGVVVIESLWPSAAFGGGSGINTLVGSAPAAPNDGAAFHDTAVWVRAA